ncbi:MAG: hypothetical protein FJY97_15750 [candidate division Zixibacteria bacterium]|nr:hypothetical protein [candidate division Zixibacteria bacterium]
MGEDIRYAIRHSDPDRQVFDVTGCRGCYESLEIPLAGEYQAVNAATAVGAVEVLQDRGFRISAEDIAEGLRSVRWPGRLQVVGRRPWVVLDGAHNAMAVRTFIQSIRVFSHDRSIVVLSFQQDKAIEEMCRAFATWADICIVPSRRVMRRRQADPALVVSLIEGFGGTAEAVGTVAEALDRAQALAGPADLICVTGSLALVGETMEVLHQLEPEEIRSREA